MIKGVSMMRVMAWACLLAAWMFASCSSHNQPENPGEVDLGEHSNLKLVLNLGGDSKGVTRADDSENPLGGENGNGLRPGEHHENDVDNLCVFAFADLGHLGVSGLPGNAQIKYCRYVDDVNFKPTYANTFYQDTISTEVNIRFDGKIVGRDDAFLVVANMGDLTQVGSLNTLGAIRDYLVNTPVTRPAAGQPLSECTAFTMANAHNSRYLGGDGTLAEPFRVAIDLERTTARVDFMYDNTLETENKPVGYPSAGKLLGYKVMNRYDVNEQTAWLYISHIKIVNVAQYAPYALKRLAYKEGNDDDSGLAYLADEEHVDDEAVKYVVEQHTWNKGKATGLTYVDLYGNTNIRYVADNYSTIFGASEAVRNYATPQTYPNANDGFNTGWSKDRISGESYYVLDYINENTIEKEYTSGLNTTALLLKTKFVPKEMYYMADNQLVSSTKAAQYGQTFWSMEKYDGTDRVKLYFESEVAAEAYKSANASATYGAPIEYKNGDTYYTIWIRHDNNGSDALIGKMEYGIVRNNIYRIGVDKVLGPGSPMPVITENPEDITLHIYVRKWNLMEVPTINI